MIFRLALFLLIPFLLPGQETDGFVYIASFGLTYTSGNSNTERLNFGFDTRKATEDREYQVKATYDYGRSRSSQDDDAEKVTDLDRGKLEAQGNRIFGERTYAYLNLAVERDMVASIDHRINGGPGLGWYAVRDDEKTLNGETGLVWVFDEVDRVTSDYIALRIAQNFNWRVKEGARVWQDFEVVSEANDPENYFINARLGVDAVLNALLGLRLEFRDNYNNIPGDGKVQNDITVVSGVTVKW